jgi:Tfp pilus assembly protein PilF
VTPRRLAELIAVAVGLAVWGNLAWDGALWDARSQFALHLSAVAALAGLLAIAMAGGALPRTRIDLPILVLLGAFGLASLSATNPGLSARALAAIVATAAMLPVALVALRHRPGWTATVVTIPTLALCASALVGLGWRRIEWLLVGAPGLPPVRFADEVTPFGSVAVPPFVILMVLPLALLIPQQALRLTIVLTLAAVGVPLTLISGSRSAWLAIGIAGLVLLGPMIRARAGAVWRSWRWTPRRIGLTVIGLVGTGLAFVYVARRLTDATSLIYRGTLWRDTIAAWSGDPLLGIGPGSMPYARLAAAPALSFPIQQPHSHDVPLGILGDAGLLGLGAAVVLVAVFVMVAAPWRARALPARAAFAVLAGCGVSMLFEDLTFEPGFNLLIILLASMVLTDAGAVAWRSVRIRAPATVAAALAAVGLLVVMVAGDGAAIAYRNGIDVAWEGRWPTAEAWLVRAMALDPWHPTGPKSLTVAADRAGHHALARAAAEKAVALSPGDADSWTNLAWLCVADGDVACARHAAERAVATARPSGRHLANAALVLDLLGDSQAADEAYRLSMLTNPWTGLALRWPRPIEIGAGTLPEAGQERNEARPGGTDAAALRLLIARKVTGERIVAADYPPGSPRALAYAMTGSRLGARQEVRRAMADAPTSLVTWEIAALIERHYGEDPSQAMAIGDVLRGSPAASGHIGIAPIVWDIGTFRPYPSDGLVSAATRLVTEGAWPWVLEPLLAPAE